MARAMHAETEFAKFDYSEAKVRALIEASLVEHSRRLIVVEAYDGLVGMIAGQIGELICSHQLQASDRVLYVRPEHRGSRAALLLVKAYLEWAESMGVAAVLMGVSSGGAHMEKAGRFLANMGFAPIGGLYRKDYVDV